MFEFFLKYKYVLEKTLNLNIHATFTNSKIWNIYVHLFDSKNILSYSSKCLLLAEIDPRLQSNNHILNNTFTSTLFEIKIDIIFLFHIDQWFKHQTCQPQIMNSKLSRPFAYIYEIKFTNHNLYTKIEYASTIWLYTFYSSCYIS